MGGAGGPSVGLAMARVPGRVIIVLDGPAGSRRACRVEDPGRLLRVWALLNAASEELHHAGMPPAAVAMLHRKLQDDVSELQRSLSPELAGELGRLMSQDDTASATADELRIEYATVLGWTGGLVVAMLDQLQLSSITTAERPEPRQNSASR